MDYNDLFILIPYYFPFIVYFSNLIYSRTQNRKYNLKENYKLYRYGTDHSAFVGANIPRLSMKHILILEEYFDTEYPMELQEIFSKFVNYVKPTDLQHCLVNLHSIKIIRPSSLKEYIFNLTSPNAVSGLYKPYENSIELYFNLKSVLSHEFIHMCSTNQFNPNLVGFSSLVKDTMLDTVDFIGNGLNEGYTELLNRRIFYGKEHSMNYNHNVRIARLIEAFFDDKHDMETAFFNNDIDAVYKAFCKFGSRQEFFSILNALDNFANAPMINDNLDSIRIQLKLYEIIKRSKDETKIRNFEKILFENPLIRIIKDGKFKLFSFDSIQKGFQR